MVRLIFIHLVAVGLLAAGYFGRLEYEHHNYWSPPLAGKLQPPRTPTTTDETASAATDSNIRFEDASRSLNVDHFYFDGAAGEFHLIETLGGGAAVFDYDNDGRVDLFMVNGSKIPPDPADRTHTAKLYANRETVGFVDTSLAAGVDLVMYGHGAAAGDVDNDGFDDVFLSGFARLVLLRNNGDGTFFEPSATGIATDRAATSSALADLDLDGDLDWYVCTYIDVPLANPLFCEYRGQRMHCEPARYPAQPDLLFENSGDGRFREVAHRAGIRDPHGRGLGVAIADFDGDGLPDVFVANDGSPNYLFRNLGGLRFTDVAGTVGAALNGEGSTMSSMGVACADYDHNGWLDLFITDFYERKNVLFKNLGPAGFVDAADPAGLGPSSRDRLGFGTLFLDADLDGNPDLFVANGHISDMSAFGIPYKMRQQFYRNVGGGFQEQSLGCGAYFHQKLLGRGTAAGDFNNDGLPDLAVNHLGDTTAVLLNRSERKGRWIGLELVGRRTNRTASNTKIWLTSGTRTLYHELAAGAAYLSSSDPRILAGLGADDPTPVSRSTTKSGSEESPSGPAPATSVATIDLRIRWPSGVIQDLRSLAADRYHLVLEPAD